MAVTIKVSRKQMAELEEMLKDIPNGLQKAIQRASFTVAKQGRTLISEQIREKVNIKKKDLDKKVMRIDRSGKVGQRLRLEKTPSFPLKYFGAKQVAKGVKYKISNEQGAKIALSAFGPEIPRLGKHVFKRTEKGRVHKKYQSRNKMKKKRFDNLPIHPLFGISPWGAFMKNKMLEPTKKKLQDKFFFQVRIEAEKLIRQKLKKAQSKGTE